MRLCDEFARTGIGDLYLYIFLPFMVSVGRLGSLFGCYGVIQADLMVA